MNSQVSGLEGTQGCDINGPRMKPRLIVASVRLPVTITRRQDSWGVAPSTGGLVTALKAVRERREFTWLGWPGTHVPENERPAVTKELAKHGTSPVFISKAHLDGFYQSFSNEVLWPLFHNLPDRSRFDLSGWNSYQTVNQMYAEAICKIAKPGDAVWIHDYQLSLVPEMLRQAGLNCPIGFFLHIPFPSAETYRTLPVSEALLRGMLGADLLGFHAYEYVSHFRMACLRVLGIESDPDELITQSRTVKLSVLPIGIDPAEIAEMLTLREAVEQQAEIERTYAGKRVVVGVDRLDYTKGIPEKLLAFEELLRAHPKWRGKVVLIQVAAPSRTGVDEYRQLKRDVDELVGRINGRFGSPSYTPVNYLNQNVRRERLTGLYRAAEIALVTPVRDGMNLVALEYVAARGDRGGTLILSEFAGAAHCLPGARLVNPYSVDQVAEVLAESLESGASRESFHYMQRFVEENTSMRWANRFLDRLEDVPAEVHQKVVPLSVSKAPVLNLVRAAQRPLVFLDYDGTLRSYVIDPKDAVPDARILDVLGRLSALATLYVISGRAGDTLDRWLGQLPIGLVCEHGLAIRAPNGAWRERSNVSGSALIRAVQPLFEDFVQRTPGSAVEYKRAAVAWHYRAADPEFGAFQAKELLTRLEDTLKRRPYKVLRGSRVIEVRHENVTKGNAVEHLLELHPDADFLFCAGDDRTDEEMMAAIPEAWRARAVTCWVGARNPRADYWCKDNRALLTELESLADLWERRGARRPQRPEPRLEASSARSSGRFVTATRRSTGSSKARARNEERATRGRPLNTRSSKPRGEA